MCDFVFCGVFFSEMATLLLSVAHAPQQSDCSRWSNPFCGLCLPPHQRRGQKDAGTGGTARAAAYETSLPPDVIVGNSGGEFGVRGCVTATLE
jgi:hypothetical protein